MRPFAKRKIEMARAVRYLFSRESIRIKSLRVRPVLWIAMGNKRRDEDQVMGRDGVSIDNVIRYCFSGDQISCRVSAHDLGKDLVLVTQF